MKAVIVEDEQPAVDNLKFYLKEYPIEIIGAADSIADAVSMIEKNKPEVVFLDINLSGENGFDLLEKTDINFKTIFVTAYSEYAIKAFEVNALDYLLKPFTKDRIAKTISRLLSGKVEDTRPANKKAAETIFISNGRRAYFIKLDDVCYIEADSCYSKIYLQNGSVKVLSKTLKKWEEELPETDFIRVHRSYIINLKQINEIKKSRTAYNVHFKHIKNTIEISRRYTTALKASMQNRV